MACELSDGNDGVASPAWADSARGVRTRDLDGEQVNVDLAAPVNVWRSPRKELFCRWLEVAARPRVGAE